MSKQVQDEDKYENEQIEAAFRKTVEDAARFAGVEPYQVTRIMWRPFTKDVLSERTVNQMGGFTFLKEQFFPYPISPFADKALRKMDTNQLSEFVGDIVGQVAAAKGMAVSDMTANEFFRYIKWGYGKNAVGIAGDVITRAGGYNRIRDGYNEVEPTAAAIDRSRLSQHARIHRKIGAMNAEKQYVFDRIAHFAKDLFHGTIPDRIPKLKAPKVAEEVHHLLISDTHYGSNIRKMHTGLLDYGPIEEARRTASLIRQTVLHQRPGVTTDLVLWLIGDLIENLMHSTKDGAITSEQVMRAIHIITQLIRGLAHQYRRVHVVVQTGNHDRFPHIDPGRAINNKADSFATLIAFAAMNALSGLENVTWCIDDTPYSIVEVFGFRFLGSHGDTFMSIAHAGKKVDVAKLMNMADTFNSDFEKNERVDAFFFGHHHVFVNTSPDADFVFNAALPPPNEFARVVNASPKSKNGQTLIVTRPDNPVFYTALLKVGKKDDQDETLDALVNPYFGKPNAQYQFEPR